MNTSKKWRKPLFRQPAGGGGRKAPAPLSVQGAKRPAAAPPGAPWATAYAKKAGGSPAWGMGHASRVVSWPSSAAGAEGSAGAAGEAGGWAAARRKGNMPR